MVQRIEIFSPKEYPFGPLSINYTDNLYIDSKKYPTVTNYIYSNLLQNPNNQNIIQSIKIKDLNNKYNELELNETTKNIEKALTIAFDTKINMSADMEKTLIDTNNRTIIYISQNDFLGMGTDNNGLNLVGKYLEQKRHQIKNSYKLKDTEKTKQETEHKLYQIYIADIALTKEITEGISDLSIYEGKSIDTIITMMETAHNKDPLKHPAVVRPPEEEVIELYNNPKYTNLIPGQVLIAINNPTTLVPYLRKLYLEEFRTKQIQKQYNLVLDMYCAYIIEKNYPHLAEDKYNEAIKQQYNKIGQYNKSELSLKIYNLYKQGMLSERLSKKIDTELSNIKIPSEDDIEKAKLYTIIPADKVKTITVPYDKSDSSEPVLIYDIVNENTTEQFKAFSVIDNSLKMNINNLTYETILDYIYVVLLSKLYTINSIKEAYDKIYGTNFSKGKPRTPDIVSLLYLNERAIANKEKTKYLAKIGLDYKFKNRLLQDLLLDTDKNILIWNDFNNLILGGGSKENPGENFIGKYMMEIRNKLIEERKSETFDKLNEDDINKFLEKDPLIHAWLEMRVRDMCKVIITLKNHVYYKSSDNIKITPDFVTTVLDKVYQPCTDIFGASNKITIDTPQWFKNIVHSCPGFYTRKTKDQEDEEDEEDEEKNLEKAIELMRQMKKEQRKTDLQKTSSFQPLVGKDVVDIIWKRLAIMIWYLMEHVKQSNTQNLKRILLKIQALSSLEKPCEKFSNNNLDNCIISAIFNLLSRMGNINTEFTLKNDIDTIDLNTVVSIILNKDIKNIKPTVDLHIKTKDEDEDEDEDKDENEDENEDEDEDEEDDDDLEAQLTAMLENDEDEDFGYISNFGGSGNTISILNNKLKEIFPDNNYDSNISEYIISATELIKTYKMSKNIKMNRINFFATQI